MFREETTNHTRNSDVLDRPCFIGFRIEKRGPTKMIVLTGPVTTLICRPLPPLHSPPSSFFLFFLFPARWPGIGAEGADAWPPGREKRKKKKRKKGKSEVVVGDDRQEPFLVRKTTMFSIKKRAVF